MGPTLKRSYFKPENLFAQVVKKIIVSGLSLKFQVAG